MPKNKDLRQRVSNTIEARWAENARVTQLLKDKLSQSLDNVSMVGNKLKTIKITIPAKHYYYSVTHIPPYKTDETDEYVLFDDKEEIMSCTDDAYVDKFSNYILSKINEELEMNSIYELMNKIDDSKSLNEKWNVKNQRELKKLKENFTVRQYSLNWDGEYEWEDEESFNTVDEAQIRFNELKEVIDNGEFDYAAIALVDENDNEISIYGEPERQKVTKEDVIEYLRGIEEVSLTDREFDYVVEDLWDAISSEMREGSVYETIDDVNMVELIDASDNPTHDLCYKLMGLYDEDPLDESLTESTTSLKEGIFGLGKKKSKSRSSNSSGDSNVKKRVTFKLYDHNGTLKFERTFTELPGKMSAEDQCKMAFKENSAYRQYCNNNPTDWTFERTSNPQDGNDTKRGRRYFVAADLHIPY